MFNQLVRQLMKLPVKTLQRSRGLAVTITLIIIVSVFASAVWFIGPNIAAQIPEYAFLSEQGLERLQVWFEQFKGMIPGEILTGSRIGDLLPQLTQLSSNWVSQLMMLFSGSLDFLLNLLLVLVTIVMLLANPAGYRRVFLLAFPQFYRLRADSILTQCENSLMGWAIGMLFNMVVITVCSAVGLLLLGVPLPMVNAMIAGLLAFIPNIGPFLSVIPPALMALAIHPWKSLAVLVLYLAIQQIEGSVLTPLVMKKQVSLLPAIALFSQVIFTALFGFIGLFLALPMVVVLQVWLRELVVKDILNRWPAPRRLLHAHQSPQPSYEDSGVYRR